MSRVCGWGNGFTWQNRSERELIIILLQYGRITHFEYRRGPMTKKPDGTFLVQYSCHRELVRAITGLSGHRLERNWILRLNGSTKEFLCPSGHWGTDYTHQVDLSAMMNNQGMGTRMDMLARDEHILGTAPELAMPWCAQWLRPTPQDLVLHLWGDDWEDKIEGDPSPHA